MLNEYPKWAETVKCVMCDHHLGIKGIKEIGIYGSINVPFKQYKAGNKSGNVFITLLCNHCGFYGPLMLETQFETLDEFIDFLKNCETVNDYEHKYLIGV